PSAHVHCFGPGAWWLLGILGAVLAASWRERLLNGTVAPQTSNEIDLLEELKTWLTSAPGLLWGLVLLAITVPILIAGRFVLDLATASALRWGMGICFLVCSALLWLRTGIGRVLARIGMNPWPGGSGAAAVQSLLLGWPLLTVLGLTAVVAVEGFSGQQPAGPAAGSFFYRVGWTASNVVPLVLVSLGLAGHGLRERSPGYMFSAGLVANATLMGGYALAVVTGGGHLSSAQYCFILQLGIIGAGLWAIAWWLADVALGTFDRCWGVATPDAHPLTGHGSPESVSWIGLQLLLTGAATGFLI